MDAAPAPNQPSRPLWKFDTELSGDLIRMGAPVVLAMLTQTGINLLDTIMVGHLPKQYSIAGQSAIGYSLILLWGIGGFLSAFQIGTQAITARRYGEGNHEGAGSILSNSVLLTASTSLVASIVAFLTIDAVFPFFNQDANVLRLGIPYAQWSL